VKRHRAPILLPSDEAAPQFTAHRLTRDELSPLLERSDRAALIRLTWHLGFLVATGASILALQATAWVVPLIIAYGYALAFLFCPFHETAHRTAFRTRWLNPVVGRFIGVLIFRPYDNYRVYHWEHHRFTQDPDRDPELHFPKPTSVGAYVLTLTGLPYLRRRFADMLTLTMGRADKPWMPPNERRGLIVEARAHLAIYLVVAGVSVVLASPAALLVWLVPFLVGQVFLQPYLLAEHTGCAHTRDSLANTRTTLTSALVRLFAWNMPYHAEHHAYPAVPFHALPRLHARVQDRLANVEPGYVAATIAVNRHLFWRRDGRLTGAR
jgi:fatty acid desaturase